MLMDNSKEKMENMILYFINNTNNCGITKLCKLMYYADFRHFKETGRSITGLIYKAWQKGPVPTKLWGQIKHNPEELSDVIRTSKDNGFTKFYPVRDFDENVFSDRELRIIKQIAYIFLEANTQDIVDSTHLPNLPWEKTWNDGKGDGEIINYELAFDDTPESISMEKYTEIREDDEAMKKISGES